MSNGRAPVTYFERFLDNHVLANLVFALILVFGLIAYNDMPRKRDPEINFNWVLITTVLPGASSIEVEKRITDPIEDTLNRKVKDIRYVSSTSRSGVSSITVRFDEISEELFDERLTDLRREVQNVYNDRLPVEATDPEVLELTSTSGFPVATMALNSNTDDEQFRRYVKRLQKTLERIEGVDSADLAGHEDPELHIAFYPDRLEGLGLSPADLADTVRSYFSDVAMGDIEAGDEKWVVRLEGTSGTLEAIGRFPIVSAQGVVELGTLADIYRTAAEEQTMVRYKGRPAVMINISQQANADTLALLDRLIQFTDDENADIEPLGYRLELTDDQSISSREAIALMENNALIGLCFVVLITWLFLGGQIALLTSIGIPFTLAGTFIVLDLMGIEMSNPVLLGVVIALGMLVDDAVVVVEAIYFRLAQGFSAMQAALSALREVFAPVLTSVLTTIAVFLPLMILPGILGQFMRVIPTVVCLGLAISLIEAFWMLPAHVSYLRINFSKASRSHRVREGVTRRLRRNYTKLLARSLRRPVFLSIFVAMAPVAASVMLAMGLVKTDFFAADLYRIFYVGAELPSGASLSRTLDVVTDLEEQIRETVEPDELRAAVSYSGLSITTTEFLFADNLGQVAVSLAPDQRGMRSTHEIIRAVEQKLGDRYEDANISVVRVYDGPPVESPINLKVMGDSFESIQAAVDDLVTFMRSNAIYHNVRLDFKPGSPELTLALNGDAIKRAGVNPVTVTRSLQSYIDGELISQYQSNGEEVDVRLIAQRESVNIDTLLQQSIATADGRSIAIAELVDAEYGRGYQNIRHFDFRRAITISADINENVTDTLQANAVLADYWGVIRNRHIGITISSSGQIDDIYESLDSMAKLFLFGVGIIYLILGTQFRSYFQPLIVLSTIPLAFSGAVFGLVMTGNPLSLFTLYGVIALAGISVNTAIVMVSAANARVESGMSYLHATVFAARRRVVPIIITSLTTIAGLFSLAAGFAGKSLVWGPVATSIVGGLFFSTGLMLIAIPTLYLATARFKYGKVAA